MAFNEQSSSRLAALASKVLRDPASTDDAKSLAGSVLTQVADHSENLLVRAALTTKVPRRMTLLEALVSEVPRENPLAAWSRSEARENALAVAARYYPARRTIAAGYTDTGSE